MKIKKLVTIILIFQTLISFSQEKRQVTFEDGNILEYTFFFDKPYDIYDWSLSANFDIITMEQLFIALNLTPYYQINEKLYFDSKIAFSLAGEAPGSYEVQQQGAYEIFPEIHYEISNKGKQKKANLWLETNYEASENVNKSYNTKINYIKRQSIYLDGGFDIGRSAGNRVLEQIGSLGSLRLISSSYAALSLGVSTRLSNYYKTGVPRGGSRSFLKVDQFAFKLLLGAPFGETLENNTLIFTENSFSASAFSELNTRALGFRISFDRERGFARKPNVFLKWGVAFGLNPTFLSQDSSFSNFEGLYSSLKLGLGFGKLRVK